MAECGHDGWFMGCDICEREQALALQRIEPRLVRHGGPVEEPPQDVFLSDDPAVGMVRADMGAWLQAHPCDCEALCECDAGPKTDGRPAAASSRCPRCEGYEATYHTFEGECSAAGPEEGGGADGD